MRRILLLLLFCVSTPVFNHAFCQDNLLAVDVAGNKTKAGDEAGKTVLKEENIKKPEVPLEELKPVDDSEAYFEKMKAYREVLENKQKELEVIKLDLEKSDLMLKKKQAEKEIFEIDKAVPQAKSENSSLTGGSLEGVKVPLVDASDIKIQLILLSDNLKEGQISLKGASYVFKEGDSIVSKLTVEKIGPSDITFKQIDGSALKLNFIN